MDSKQERGQSSSVWRSAVSLGLVAIIGTGLLAGVNQLTRERILEQERRAILAQLGQLIPPGEYDNALHEDFYTFTDKAWFPSGQSVTAYRARLQSEPVAIVLKLAATGGYNGNINLLVGINVDGSLSGVRVASHKETPGLGDAIETAKSDWISGFSGRSLEDPNEQGWMVKRDGGEFDQFTGATITPRAVVKAVHLALKFFAANREKVFQQPADVTESERSASG